MTEDLNISSISARGELHRVTRTLKQYLKWQRANGAIGSVPAPPAERAAFEATQKAREQAKLDKLKAGLRGPQASAPTQPPSYAPPAAPPRAPAAPDAPTSAPSPPEQGERSTGSPVPTSRFAKKEPSAAQPAPDILGSSTATPWKTLGSRPAKRFQGHAAAPEASAPTQTSAPTPERAAPSRPTPQRAAPAQSAPNPSQSEPQNMSADEDDIYLMDGDESELEMPSDYDPAMFYDAPPSQPAPPKPAPALRKDPAKMSKPEKLAFLQNYMGDCRRCGLCEGRKSIVFGAGNPDARLVFVADAPSASDDQAGSPFAQSSVAGTPDELLAKMVKAMGLSLDDVYLCTVLKCRPPGDRPGQLDEVKECQPFLFKQLGVIEPEVIVALGGFATKVMSLVDPSIKPARGQWQTWRGTPLMPTYHPRELVASQGRQQVDMKRTTWQDLQSVMAKLGLK
ncbi:uracil-DNA glycosylase [Bradymonas sediminis]|uniref:Uncharacterized protein n=1 Tax=Bradymonas sediminis TaxID=1548548 RepID=A0A2Z4FGJ2_9DELT|nr:uracil-DNA glycosylase [Bradymonas sediminis]AWV88102.1 hypothetical protein DN745_01635 [Bradymonas sediminis]TDP77225.1 uracil-DNA glycosylase family 4 [Bradymonas sediminis]